MVLDRSVHAHDGVPSAPDVALYRLRYATMTYDYLAPSIESLTGFTAAEIASRGLRSIVVRVTGPGASQEVYEALLHNRLGGHSAAYKADYQIRTRAGNLRWLADHSVPWQDEHGEPIGSVGVLVDVTARREAEEALRTSEERFRVAALTGSDVIWEWNLDTDLVEWFGDVDALLGVLSGTFPRTLAAWSAVIHEDDRARVTETRRQHVSSGTLFTEHYRVGRSDGSLRYWTERGQILGPRQDTHRMVGSVTDITERRNADHAVQEANAVLNAILEATSDAIFLKGLDGRYLLINSAGARLVGRSPGEVIGLRDTDLFDPESAQAIVNEDLRVLAGARPESYEGTRTTAAGQRISFDTVKAPVVDPSGRTLGVVGFSRNVTSRRESEEALRRSEERYKLLFDLNPRPMWVYESSTLRVLAVNEAACEQYGYTEGEFLALTLRDLRPPAEQPVLDLALREVADLWKSSRVVIHQRKDGRFLTVEVASHPIEMEGRKGRLVTATDITERRELEEQLRQAQKMEALGRLAGGIAHDFNNLLSVITGFTELAVRGLDSGAPAVRRLNEVLKASGRAAELTQQLLAFSRRQVVDRRVLDLKAAIADLETMLTRVIGEEIELVTVHATTPAWVRMDAGQLAQVLMNLAINARDAMPRGGRLSLETRLRHVLSGPDVPTDVAAGAYVVLEVRDTGTGMDAEARQRAFEPFFTTKPPGQGTGLGLSTAYGIVKQSGGFVDLVSEPGRGTSVVLHLPLEEAEVDAAAVGPSPDVGGGTETILLVEDDRSLRELIREMLEEAGYVVREADSGASALALADLPFDCLLTDLVMPAMRGDELARRILAVHPGTRVVFMSGYTDSAGFAPEHLQAGTLFLQKPFASEALLRALRTLLDDADGNAGR